MPARCHRKVDRPRLRGGGRGGAAAAHRRLGRKGRCQKTERDDERHAGKADSPSPSERPERVHMWLHPLDPKRLDPGNKPESGFRGVKEGRLVQATNYCLATDPVLTAKL